MAIRARTLWPHYIGGLTFRNPNGGHWRISEGGKHMRSEGAIPGKRGDYWPAGPGRDLHIKWWRMKLARRRDDDRASWRNT